MFLGTLQTRSYVVLGFCLLLQCMFHSFLVCCQLFLMLRKVKLQLRKFCFYIVQIQFQNLTAVPDGINVPANQFMNQFFHIFHPEASSISSG